MMAGEMNSLGHVWNVHGKNVTPMYDEDVYELIGKTFVMIALIMSKK